MARQNKIRWTKLTTTVLLSGSFLVGLLICLFVFGKPVAVHAQGVFATYKYVTKTIVGTPPKTVYEIEATDPKNNGSRKTTCAIQSDDNPYLFFCDTGNYVYVLKSSTGKANLYRSNINEAPTDKNNGGSAISVGGDVAGYNKFVAANPGKTTPSGTGTGTGTTADEDDIDPELDCVKPDEKLNLSWIVCAAVFGINKSIDALDKIITDLLIVDQKKIFDDGTPTGKRYHAAWSTFRAFAVGLLIIAGLIMVIAHALGFEVLDAYTIRKVLPRLIVAIIGITLSWELMDFFVGFTNDLGLGVQHIIYYPFKDMAGAAKLGGGAGFAVAFAAIGITAAMTLLAVGSFALTGLLAALVAFLILVLRQLILVVLILSAPIAIACYVLPNTQGVWKIWHESFSKALLMFPIIMAFIAVGRVFAISAIGDGVNSQSALANVPIVSQLIGFVAYFLPYFLIPLTVRFAGGALRTVGGLVNDRSRGGFDRLKKYRGAKTAESLHNMSQGTRFNSKFLPNRALNTLTSRATTANGGLGKKGKAAYEQKMGAAAAEFGKGKGSAVMFNDSALQAMTYGSSQEAAKRMAGDFNITGTEEEKAAKVNSAIAAVQANGGFGKARQVFAAKQLAATGTGYDDDSQFYSTIARVSGGNKDLANSMWGEMRGTSERAGRNDLKASYGMGEKLLSDMIDNGDTRAYSGANATKYEGSLSAMGVDAARGVDGMSLARNKPKSVQNLMKRMDQDRQRHEVQFRTGKRAVRNSNGTWEGVGPTISSAERNFSEVQLGQIRTKMENMQDHTMYGPEVTAEAVYGSRNRVDGREAYSGQRKAGTATVLSPAQTASSRAGSRASSVATEERMQRGPSLSEDDVARSRGGPGDDHPGAG